MPLDVRPSLFRPLPSTKAELGKLFWHDQSRTAVLGGAARRALTGAAMQQGLIQIVRDFCEHSNALCENCRFPELVREWNDQHQMAR